MLLVVFPMKHFVFNGEDFVIIHYITEYFDISLNSLAPLNMI